MLISQSDFETSHLVVENDKDSSLFFISIKNKKNKKSVFYIYTSKPNSAVVKIRDLNS